MDKLPFWATLGRVYAAIVLNFPRFIQLALLWVAGLGLARWALADLDPADRSIVTLLLLLAAFIAASIFATAWYRLLVAASAPRPFWGAVIQVAATGFLFLLAVFVVPGALAGLIVMAGLPFELLILPGLLLLAAGFLSGRVGLAFPAAAIGDREFGVRASWRTTRGNTFRLGFGLLLTTGPLYLASHALDAAIVDMAQAGAAPALVVALDCLTMFLVFLETAVTVAFTALAYRHFRAGGLSPAERRDLVAAFE